MRTTLATATLVAIAMLLLEGAGCSKDSSNPYGQNSVTPPANTPNTVVISGMAFNPATITVGRNATVTWTNEDGVVHTATGNTGAWDTGNIQPGTSRSVMFSTAGTYQYHCTVHPYMMGIVVVQ